MKKESSNRRQSKSGIPPLWIAIIVSCISELLVAFWFIIFIYSLSGLACIDGGCNGNVEMQRAVANNLMNVNIGAIGLGVCSILWLLFSPLILLINGWKNPIVTQVFVSIGCLLLNILLVIMLYTLLSNTLLPSSSIFLYIVPLVVIFINAWLLLKLRS